MLATLLQLHTFVERDKTNKKKIMNTPISQFIPRFREKLAANVTDIERYDDEILANAIKTVIQFGKLNGKTLSHDHSTINPAIAENSEEAQQLILEACLILLEFQRGIPPSITEKLKAELHKIKNGEDLFSGK